MKVFASKNLVLAGIALAGVMGFTQSALAYSPTGAGSATPIPSTAVPKPSNTNLTVFMQSFPCRSTFNYNVSAGGVPSVTSASFAAGSAVCPFITIVPGWTINAATLISPGVYQATISGISVTVKQPSGTLVATCTGSVTGTLDQNPTPHRFTFSGNLTTTAPVSGQTCAVTTLPGQYLETNLTAP